MINKNSLKCTCGCQDKVDLEIDPSFLMTLMYIDEKYGLKRESIISGYRCSNQIQKLAALAKKGLGNMPARNGEHTKYPIMACDLVHSRIKEIFKEMCERHSEDYGIGFYINIRGFSMHIDSRNKAMKWVCDRGIYVYSHKESAIYQSLLDRYIS
jgi:hypothetical protein